MNYYGPRKLLAEGADREDFSDDDVVGWMYTRKHGSGDSGNTFAIGYCAGEPARPGDIETGGNGSDMLRHQAEERWDRIEEAGVAHKFHREPHDTKGGACECYKEYLLDLFLVFNEVEKEDADRLVTCEADGCREMTPPQTAEVRHPRGPWFDLCPGHLDRETVEDVFEVGESFGTR